MPQKIAAPNVETRPGPVRPIQADPAVAAWAAPEMTPADLARRPADFQAMQRLVGNRALQRQALARAQRRPLAPVIQRQPPAPGQDVRQPETFPTYEGWLEAFHSAFLATEELRAQHTFTAHDTARTGVRTAAGAETEARPTSHLVLGAPAGSLSEAPTPQGEVRADQFIDHPTDEWVRAHLPERLRQTAYQLPADCADIAVVLRHVWVASHRRSETYRGWTIGYHPGGLRAEQARVREVIRGQGSIFSGNIQQMLNPYSDSSGRPIRDFRRLQFMLHPGDILVWQHHRDSPTVRSGGHTQTISHIARDPADGHITTMTLLQGNQPIGPAQAAEIREQEADEGRRDPGEMPLRHAAGRRIEVATMEAGGSRGDLLVPSDFEDVEEPVRGRRRGPAELVWTWLDGHTRLVAAGPAAAAQRPAARRRRGEAQAVRRLSDWTAALASAGRETLAGRFESMLLEARSLAEGGAQAGQNPIADDEARAVGQAAGENVWRRARQAARYAGRDAARRREALGDQTHFQTLQQMQAMLAAVRAAGLNPRVAEVLNLIEQGLVAGGRGASTVSFERAGTGRRQLVRVLLTGFDPFNTAETGAAPRAGEWNPSGAAVMALDGAHLDLGRRARVAVEGLVLPVSFEAFAAGMVEEFVRPHAQAADAVITVSMDPNLAPGSAVRLERFAVNAHQLDNGQLRPISGAGPAIVQARAPLDEIAAAAEHTPAAGRGGGAAIPRPDIGLDITFHFESAADANAARGLLGQPAREAGSAELENPFANEVVIPGSALSQVRASGRADGTWVRFELRGRAFEAQIVRGPGGNYLSNEVSYRVLNLLQGEHALSFHVHTQRGGAAESVVPADISSPAGRAALETATQVRTTLIETLRRMLRAVGEHVSAPQE